MKYQIVEFRNKKFGIRKRNIFQNIFNYGGSYYDFYTSINNFITSDERYFLNCQTEDIELVFRKHSELTNNVVFKVIK
jgi:hypothetical protein